MSCPGSSSSVNASYCEVKATKRPVAEIEGSEESAWPGAPFTPSARETRTVVPSRMSRTKTSRAPSPSASLRFVAYDENATNRPLSETDG